MNNNKQIEPKNILVLSLAGIGNFLMHSPVFEALKNSYPKARITVWVAPRGTRILAENNPYIDHVIESSIKLPAHKHGQLVYRLVKEKFDTGIVLSPGQLWKSAAYLYLAGVSHRIGNTYPFRGDPKSSFLLTNAVEETADLHDVEQNLRLLEPLGIENTEIAHYDLTLPAVYEQDAQVLISKAEVRPDKKIVGFHAGSAPDFLWKRWPVENFIEVGRKLIGEKNAHILIFGGPEEKELKQQLKGGLSEQTTIVATDLLTCAALMKHCALFLSNDSGLMHVAAAVGVPAFGLFGPTDEKKTGPRGAKSLVIRATGTQPSYDTEKNYSLGTASHESMQAITPQLVIDKIFDSL